MTIRVTIEAGASVVTREVSFDAERLAAWLRRVWLVLSAPLERLRGGR